MNGVRGMAKNVLDVVVSFRIGGLGSLSEVGLVIRKPKMICVHLDNNPRKKNVLQASLVGELRHEFQIMRVSGSILRCAENERLFSHPSKLGGLPVARRERLCAHRSGIVKSVRVRPRQNFRLFVCSPPAALTSGTSRPEVQLPQLSLKTGAV